MIDEIRNYIYAIDYLINICKTILNFSTGNQPQCKPITCGQPPEVLNARFYLTNGTSTAWQSLARYSCKPGFKMIYQESKFSYSLSLIRPEKNYVS